MTQEAFDSIIIGDVVQHAGTAVKQRYGPGILWTVCEIRMSALTPGHVALIGVTREGDPEIHAFGQYPFMTFVQHQEDLMPPEGL